jgi:hypothetical protein
MMQYGVVIFHTTTAVMQAEKILIKAGLNIKLMPVPREFSSDCGISIRFDWPQHEEVKRLLDESKVEIEAVHLMQK